MIQEHVSQQSHLHTHDYQSIIYIPAEKMYVCKIVIDEVVVVFKRLISQLMRL